MTDKKKDSRINIEDLPKEEQDLPAEASKEVKGGLLINTSPIDVNVATGDVNNDGRVDSITGAGLGGGPHVKR